MFDLNAYKAKNYSWCFKTQMKKLPSLSNLFLHFQMCFESKYFFFSFCTNKTQEPAKKLHVNNEYQYIIYVYVYVMYIQFLLVKI